MKIKKLMIYKLLGILLLILCIFFLSSGFFIGNIIFFILGIIIGLASIYFLSSTN